MSIILKALTQDELRHYKKSLLRKPYLELSPTEMLHQFQFLSSCYAQRKDRKGVSIGLSKKVLKRLNFLTGEIFSGLESRKQEIENSLVLGGSDSGVQKLSMLGDGLKPMPGETGVYEETLCTSLREKSTSGIKDYSVFGFVPSSVYPR